MKEKKSMTMKRLSLSAGFILAVFIIWILTSWIHPVKYAIEEKDFHDYSEYILVREKLDCYLIKDWYPVYPVVRNSVLPQFFYPRGI